jgi:hypothetical protein
METDMFADEEPSVDDTIFQDLRFVGGSAGRTKVRGSYPIVARDVPAALALGFRHRLTQTDIDRLLSAVIHCCHYYAASTTLPITIFGPVGHDGDDVIGSNTTPKESTPTERPVVYREAFLNPVAHGDWVKLVDGLISYHRRGETCWLFARTIANLSYHSPVMGLSKAGRDTTIAIDARLIRLGALRLAVGSFVASVAIAACVELVALLVEMQGDQELFRRYGRRIHRLFEATSARLWKSAAPPLHRQFKEDGPDLPGLPTFWTEASVTWLREIVFARESGFLPGDELILNAQKLFSKLPPPSGEEFSAAMNRRRGGTRGDGHQGNRRDETHGEASGRTHKEAEDAPSNDDASSSVPSAAGENSFAGRARQPDTGKTDDDGSLTDPFGLGSRAVAALADAIDERSKEDDVQDPDLKRFYDSLRAGGEFRSQPVMRLMDHLDLSPHADEGKRKYAEQFRVLTSDMPLTALPRYKDLIQYMGNLREAMPNFGPIIDALQGDFAFALRSEGPAVLRLRPMLIIGPPAIGKTRFARELAKALGAESAYISVAGDADNRRFAGTAHGFTSAHPSWPVERIHKLSKANPVLIVDEIEKAGGSKSNGVLTDTILGLLEPESAKQFTDPFLGGPIDLSAISWIFLANSREGLSQPLLSRLEVFQVEPPEPEAFDFIVQAIVRDIAKSRKVEPDQMPALPEQFLAELKVAYAERRDLRRVRIALEKALGILARYDNEHPGETLH